MSYSPIMYDLKRGFLRLSTLLVLALFTSAGIGLAYATQAMFAMSRYIGVTGVSAYIDPNTNTFRLEGFAYNYDLRPVRLTIEYELSYVELSSRTGAVEKHSRTLVRDSVSSQGRFNAMIKLPEDVKFDLNTYNKEYIMAISCNISTPIGAYSLITNLERLGNYLVVNSVHGQLTTSTYIFEDQQLNTAFTPTKYPDEKQVAQSTAKPVGKLDLALFKRGNEWKFIILLFSTIETNYRFYMSEVYDKSLIQRGLFNTTEDQSLVYRYIGEIKHGLNLLSATVINTNTTAISFIVNATYGKTNLYSMGNIYYVALTNENPEQVALVSYMTSSTGLDLFRQFFPIVALYLVYIYIAKPRSQGALEFLLARPITRKDVFITRYIAGVLVTLVSTTLFYLTVVLAVYAIIGVTLKPSAQLLIYSGLLLSMIAYYSLFYLFAALTSGGRYLASSIVTYVFYWIILPIIATLYVFTTRPLGSGIVVEIVKLQYQLYYLSPSGIYSFSLFYVYKDYGIRSILGAPLDLLEEIVNPQLVSISTLMWITIPVAVAWIMFKKANLSS